MSKAATVRRENEDFENEVRRIAKLLWPGNEYLGATVFDGRERDGIFETEDCIHVLETTVSRQKEKAKQDIGKVVSACIKLRRSSRFKAVRGWWVTREEPTVDQRKIADKHRNSVNALSFSQFRQQLVDSRGYLAARREYPFGSVRDPGTGDASPRVDYISLDLVSVGSGELVSRVQLVSLLEQGRKVVLLGDYGSGKSMTLRELYRELSKAHLEGDARVFPLYLNLRDHYGQVDPAEVLERHARSIGFFPPSNLVRAWRSGYVCLLLDGFDEISTVGVQGLWKRLRDNRYRAMEAVRRLIREHPVGSGLVVAGRAHFFDSAGERRRALGLLADALELTLNEFTDEQIAAYLAQAGFAGSVPEWLPSRPLLVGYLAAKGLIGDVVKAEADGQLDPASGWNQLLDDVAEREAEVEAGIDGGKVRRILEHLATRARNSVNGLGPISADAVIGSFSSVCGYQPDERGMVLLQRLPGLGADENQGDARSFVDEDFADACRAGDLVAFIENPFGFDATDVSRLEAPIGELGIAVAARQVRARQFNEGKVGAALEQAERADGHYMAADLVRLQMELGYSLSRQVKIRGVFVPELDLSASAAAGDLSGVEFADCYFGSLETELGMDASRLPRFDGCMFGRINGWTSRGDMPSDRFDDSCVVENFFGSTDTTSSIMELELPLGSRVCATILKKLYERRGTGRKENALRRGLDHRAGRFVDGVLRVLHSEGLASPYRARGITIWLPDRSSQRRVGRITSAPATSDDAAMRKCGELEV